MKRFIRPQDVDYLIQTLQTLYQTAHVVAFPEKLQTCVHKPKTTYDRKYGIWGTTTAAEKTWLNRIHTQFNYLAKCPCDPTFRYLNLLEELENPKQTLICPSGFKINAHNTTHAIEQLAKRIGLKLTPRIDAKP